MATDLNGWRVAVSRTARELAERTFQLYCRDLSTPLYLGGVLDETGCWDGLTVGPETDGFSAMRGEPLPRNQGLCHLADTIERILRAEPLALVRDYV